MLEKQLKTAKINLENLRTIGVGDIDEEESEEDTTDDIDKPNDSIE